MNPSELETQLAFQCAPLLTGIKISNLLIVNGFQQETVMQMFQGTGISYYLLNNLSDRTAFLLYQKRDLLDYLHKREVRQVMKMLGYQKDDLESILKEFSKRYEWYMKYKEKFPHELGLLLGYPVEDVTGFIENQGKNFLYTGYWKVYGNVEERRTLFENYTKAKELVIQMMAQGMSIQKILELHMQA